MSILNDIEAKIRIEARNQRLSLYELCSSIEMTEAGFYKMLSTGSMKIKTLENIANALNLPINFFFNDKKASETDTVRIEQVTKEKGIRVYSNEEWHLIKEIKLLNKTIDDKNQIIKLLLKDSMKTNTK